LPVRVQISLSQILNYQKRKENVRCKVYCKRISKKKKKKKKKRLLEEAK
jgi:hypothetical protein